MSTSNSNTSVYDQDFYLWIQETIQALQLSKLDPKEIPHLIEELEDMGNSQKDALESNLIRVLQHLLKWKYQKHKRTDIWRASITEHSLRLNRAFKKSPSLRPYFAQVFDECYSDARLIASRETGLELEVFPQECPFDPKDVLNPEYLP
ncbi:DUF29 domain-containing protein [Cylindrospermopsis raciborskii]|uniref:DUF29 domain-containing protein n=1 Tax=Cylindrospermopsis raciborskii TaxID=77022 RepID=UPI003DA3DA72